MSKLIAIYVRRSVSNNDNNSLSIDSQKVDCVKSLEEGEELCLKMDRCFKYWGLTILKHFSIALRNNYLHYQLINRNNTTYFNADILSFL